LDDEKDLQEKELAYLKERYEIIKNENEEK